MMWRLILYCAVLAVVCTGTSCNTTKNIPANDALYMGATVKVEGDGITAKKRKAIKGQLQALTRPKPNSRILGLPVKLYFWNMGGFFRKKFGEPPVLLSTLNLGNNTTILQNNLENAGYFRASVAGDTLVKSKKATAVYTTRPGAQYTINEIVFPKDSSVFLSEISRTKPRSLLKPGEPFDLGVIKAERIRIDSRLKNRGFYFFDPEYLLVDTDSTIGNNKVNLYVNPKKETPPQARQVYKINKVFIYPNYSLSDAQADTNPAHARFHSGYYVVDSSQTYKPKLFAQAMQFDPGETYNRRIHNATLNRLINLGIFKFVKNRFEAVGDTSLNAYYYLTPLPKKSLRAEIGGSSKSNNFTGTQITLGFTNRNTFRGGEILTVDAYVGSEVQVSGQSSGSNLFRLGAEANLTFPRFETPFISVNPDGGFVPRTNMQLGYDILNRQKYYTLTSYRAGLGYIWKESAQKEHTLYPISIQYVQPSKVTPAYLDSVQVNPNFAKAIDTQFILGGNYNYLYNSLVRGAQGNGIFFNGLLDLSGNIAGMFTKGSVRNGGKEGRILGAPFSQYVKVETDFRVYRKIGESSIWANRIIVGVGIPHGNSEELPFIKQFFVGGNNSLRAFRSRSVGPGIYLSPSTGEKTFAPDQSGDMKLELNTELRLKLVNMVFGALFVDAGNVWLFNENPSRPGGKFSKDFISELAVGTGVGVRFDINILVLRLDVGFPIRKPYLDPRNRWVINQIEFRNPNWRKSNLVFNLAIGYPF